MISVRELMEMLKAGGPYAMAAIFILGGGSKRRDRRDQESHMRAVYEKTVTLVQETTRTVDRMESAVIALTEAIRAMNGGTKR